MLTLFTIPKPFGGHVGVIQRNAITSWTLLGPECEIILFGDDDGTAEAASEFGVRHLPEVARNGYGTPLLDDLIGKARRAARHRVLCLVNADIILTSDLPKAASRVARRMSRYLIVGRRRGLDMEGPFDYAPGWEARLQSLVLGRGRLYSPRGTDYFVFPRGLWRDIPPFAVGRPAYDNWLVYRTRAMGVPVIDATDAVAAVHQSHDYSHVPAGTGHGWEGPEADANRRLAGGRGHIFTLLDATHTLGPRGLRPALGGEHLRRRLRTTPRLYLDRLPFAGPLKAFLRMFRPVGRILRRAFAPGRSA